MTVNMLRCKITKLAETILPAVVADVPVCIYGQTGIGKSSVVNYDLVPALSKILGIEAVMHDYRFSTKDVVDGTGMPIIDPVKRRTDWTCPAFIPEDDGRLHVIFCDEIGHANVQMQHLGYGLVNDRALGGFKLPKLNRVLLATNTREDQGGDNKLLLPFCNRMGHVLAESDATGHIENMKRWGYDSRLIAFLSLRPDEIQKVSDLNPAFPTHRSVEMLNKILKALPVDAPKSTIENSAHMVVGEGFTRQFVTFLNNLAAGLPKMSDIKANPLGAKVPTDPHYQWVIGSAVSKELNTQNAAHLSQYLERLMPDVRSMAAHDAMTRDASLKQVAALKALVLGG
jgi:hypothetical protein